MKRFCFLLLAFSLLFSSACSQSPPSTQIKEIETAGQTLTQEKGTKEMNQTKETKETEEVETEPPITVELGEVVDGLPKMNDSLKGTYKTGNGTEQVYENVTETQWEEYGQRLRLLGYTKYQSHSWNGKNSEGAVLKNNFAVYTSDTEVLTLNNHTGLNGRTFVIREARDQATLPQKEYEFDDSQAITDTLFTQIGSEDITKITDPGAEFEQENDMCFVVRLADGSFVIIDSAETQTAPRLYATLKKQAPDPDNIVIAAWIITHPHVDHYRGFLEFARLYGNDSTITVKDFVYNFSDQSTIKADSWNEQVKIVNTMNNTYPDARHVRPHTGNLLYYGNVTLRFLYTQEDFLAANNGVICNVNGTSLVFRLETDCGATALIVADHPIDGNSSGGTWCENALELWYGTALKSQLCNTFHHGFGGGATKEIYYTIQPDIVLWDTDWYRLDLADGAANARNRFFCEKKDGKWVPKDFVYVAGSTISVFRMTDGFIRCITSTPATKYLAS